MLNKTLHALFIAIAVCGLIFTACDKSNNPMVNNNDNPNVYLSDPVPPTTAYTTPIMAGQSINVGDVYVWFQGVYVYIQYQTDHNVNGDWLLYETHAHIATSFDDLPHSSGGLVPGQFTYKEEFLQTPRHIYTFAIPINEWIGVEHLYIAAHCCVFYDANGNGIWDETETQEETGWGQGLEYGNNWSMYFVIDGPIPKPISLPPTTTHIEARYAKIVDASLYNPYLWGGTPSQFTLRYVPGGYDVTNTTYNSFCLDLHVTIWQNWYDVKLYSSYDPAMPDYAKYNCHGLPRVYDIPLTLTPYDKINYLLNKYCPPYPYSGPFLDGIVKKLQHIYWYYRGEPDVNWNRLTGEEQAMVNDANLHGGGYYPPSGGWMAILLDFGNSLQLCFIVVDP